MNLEQRRVLEKRGAEDRHKGKTIRQCPFRRGTPERGAWEVGWALAGPLLTRSKSDRQNKVLGFL